jgi:hypothetical protein
MKTGINIILLTALVSAIVGEIQSTDPTEKYQFALIAFIAIAGILGTNLKTNKI